MEILDMKFKERVKDNFKVFSIRGLENVEVFFLS